MVGTANEQSQKVRVGDTVEAVLGHRAVPLLGPNAISLQELLQNEGIRRWHSWPLQ